MDDATQQDARNTEREQRILDAALTLITHYGYDKTTVDDIAREAGISKGAIYLHFKSKVALFEALVLRESDLLAEELIQRVMDDPQGGTIFSIFGHSLSIFAANPLLKALYTRDRRILGDLFRSISKNTMQEQTFAYGVEFVEQMQAAGLMRQDINPSVLAYLLSALRYGVLTVDDAIEITDAPPIEAVSAVVIDMLHRSFAPEGGDSEAGKQAFMRLIEFGREIIRQRQASRAQ
ncbi:MAG: TetR/AcrR family transcriptional regulator [Anaerolineae bacterium]|nr:TetR/AcrR family transcriptional regulator [Anaerolineae bacterium]